MSEYDQTIIKEFNSFLEEITDHRKDVYKVIDFLNTLLRVKNTIPPTVEVVTILRNERPILFQSLKQIISPVSPLYMIIKLDMDLDEAKKRLAL
ncbi:hypothetical protein TEPIDINF_001424 [Tepidibacillus infernus]|uniref:Uncharacterized protein n=1 Tax=Tepidibacillus decaturensis TaxID=1413211 RepID=A0A135L4V4_9BACI|nr:hypothetical protein [Tepidibacillus decaturensis]KXG43959.1 hypothetical protein U473_08015 [Tepidibacillus decaturensis]